MAYPILKGFADPERNHDWTLVECAIKEKTERVLHRLTQSQPEMILASAYIFSCKELYEILWYVEEKLRKCSTYAGEDENERRDDSVRCYGSQHNGDARLHPYPNCSWHALRERGVSKTIRPPHTPTPPAHRLTVLG